MDKKVDQNAETAILESVPKLGYERPAIVQLARTGMAVCAPGAGVAPEPEGTCTTGNSPGTPEGTCTTGNSPSE
jgi:hypothetical protein